MGSFESSTHVDRSRRRQDFIRLTQHDRFVREDYERARSVGLRVVREDLRWYLCERDVHGDRRRRGEYDFSSFAPFVDATQATGINHINCLLHYVFPLDADPLQRDFPQRFAAFATAFARWRVHRVDPPRWYCAVNEISFLAFAAGDAARFAPFHGGQTESLTAAPVRASLAATDAIRLGVDLQGICLFPVVDMGEWKRGRIGPWGQLGLRVVREDEGILRRVPNERYLAALADTQARVAAALGTPPAQLIPEEATHQWTRCLPPTAPAAPFAST